jgi:hypothetical protein
VVRVGVSGHASPFCAVVAHTTCYPPTNLVYVNLLAPAGSPTLTLSSLEIAISLAGDGGHTSWA